MKITITVPHEQLLSAFARVAPAMSRESTRYYLRGICFDWTQETQELVLVATDGHRLHNVKLSNFRLEGEGGKIPASFNIIVSDEFVRRFLAQKPSKEEKIFDVTLLIDTKAETIEAADMSQNVTRGKLVDGTFPEWRRVIPGGKLDMTATINVAYLEATLKAAKAGKVKALVLRFAFANGQSREQCSTPILTADMEGGEYVLMPMRGETQYPRALATDGKVMPFTA